MKIHLTPKQAGALLHRLSIADAIIESLTDKGGELEHFNMDNIDRVAAMLEARVATIAEAGGNTRALTIRAFSGKHNQAIAKAILRDAVEGSTWLVAAADMPIADFRGKRQTANALARKLREAGIENNGFPLE